MPQSRQLRSLAKRVLQLERDLLPRIRPLGNYTLREQDQIRAFRLLAHAEMEAFLEEAAVAIVDAAQKRYKASTKPNRVMKALWQTFGREGLPRGGADAYEVASKRYTNQVKKNNGLKEQNICSMFLPLGIDHGVLDLTWLASMDSFGSKRGQVAHSSFKVQSMLDPAVEGAEVRQLMAGIGIFDQNLGSLRNCR